MSKAKPKRQAEPPNVLPVLPLKETVVFPDSMTPLAIGQERSIKLIDDVVAGERELALLTVRNDVEAPGFGDLHSIGTAAVVHKMIRVPDGTMRILVQGGQLLISSPGAEVSRTRGRGVHGDPGNLEPKVW